MKLHSASILVVMALAAAPRAWGDGAAAQPVLQVPAGFTIELVAGPPLVERPIVGAFDDDGRLYIAESSGSNDPVEKQLELKPHRIARLEDVDGDGRFDKRTTFADRMMFPEGAMWLDGSLYVSAPPSIWKLTDRDGDGVAEERVEWFQGKTLTGCANDLHGPYLGLDGWIYWCKGAFADQTHQVRGREWKTSAAHIFRCRPDGTGFEPVMTGGMDNPVDVVFTPAGEPIFSATYFVGDGRRDGFAHAAYGGVFGKEHGVLAGHPRTGDLMPAISLMSPVAPCGMERYEHDALGGEFRDNLFLCQFNMRKVSRHVLSPAGSTFTSEDSDFVISDHVDFHPTDVLADADGSLIVVNTGGWYKLCCPTSQLWKPDVLGGIYRVRREGAKSPADPRGLQITWSETKVEQLWELLTDPRQAVRQRATREFVRRKDSTEMHAFLTALASSPADATTNLPRAWALAQLELPQSARLIRALLRHPDEQIRHAAIKTVSLYRDAAAAGELVDLLIHEGPANRRAAAEALGRIGDPAAVSPLLKTAHADDDRILRHSITYALIEIGDADGVRRALANASPPALAAALIALDQMPGGELQAHEVVSSLNAENEILRQAARWIAAQRPKWGGDVVRWLDDQLRARDLRADEDSLESLVVTFASASEIQELLARVVAEPDWSSAAKEITLRAIAQTRLDSRPPAWDGALAHVLSTADARLVPLAVEAARALPPAQPPDVKLVAALVAVSEAEEHPLPSRIAALAAVVDSLSSISESQFALLANALNNDDAKTRADAADALSRAALSPPQLHQLCDALKSAGPLELNRLLPALEKSSDPQLAQHALAALREANSLASLRIDILRQALAKHDAAIQRGIDELESLVNVDAADQRQRIDELLPLLAGGNVRRGHAVFHSAKASCSVCHVMGHAGGVVGPELSHIGEIRTERDLLESILFPSLSFVRSYEPMLLLTTAGQAVSGTIRDETPDEYVLDTGLNQQVRVPRDEVEEIQPGTVSIMPAGLDKQFSTQELADLVAFLKNTKDN